MNDTQHTPLPWTFDGHSCIVAIGHTSDAQRAAASADICISAAAGELTICCSQHDMCPEQTVIHYNEAEAKANLTLIYKAVNSHADLLAACELAVKNTERAIGDPAMFLPIRFACQAAVGKAKPKGKTQ